MIRTETRFDSETTTNSNPIEIGAIKKYQILMFKKHEKFNTLWKRVEKMAIFGYEFYFR